MAPKTRYTPAANKGKAIVTSSNASKRPRANPPSYPIYLTTETEERARVIKSWPLHREREVDLASIEITGVSEVIHAKKWHKFCAKPHKIYPSVVREFLANFNDNILGGDDEDEEAHAFHTYVRGVWVPFSPDVIQHFYQVTSGTALPDIEDWNQVAHFCFNEDIPPVWPCHNVVLHNELNLKAKMFHYILSSNIAPSSHMIEIYPPRMQLLYTLATGHDLNFGERIFQQIVTLALTKGSKKRIYFPALISALCKQAKVPTSSSKLDRTKPILINLYTIRQSQTQIVQHRHAAQMRDAAAEAEEEDEAAEYMEPETPPAVRPPLRRRSGGVNFGPTLEAMQAQIQENREEQDRQFRLFQAGLDILRADLRTQHEEMRSMFAQLLQYQPPPPPEDH
ncbi:uncharacterized protein LOC127810533 [Diospyros lotus]|uniref:uncharacterized protein LOC127810533 n=1 Tax=Diospyros lotus TaxID=55363 RepID=UPI00225556A0|nr:uncharacterized protein LOC127810533 [Diospyros lotus]